MTGSSCTGAEYVFVEATIKCRLPVQGPTGSGPRRAFRFLKLHSSRLVIELGPFRRGIEVVGLISIVHTVLGELVLDVTKSMMVPQSHEFTKIDICDPYVSEDHKHVFIVVDRGSITEIG